ncbi:hypothetical protein [Rudanella lutea]|jgi:O-antigen/teichoic acid export membrane protein|uniref:hypothetical protein n=1 Tax=Rudanella lutea TaxID=451374 RepID=UPI000360914A|nr:hypothetical protein [Rudanella lutea]
MLRSILFTLILAFVFFIAERFGYIRFIHPLWKVILLFYLSLSFLMHRLVELGNQEKGERFIPFYMGFTVARLVLSVAFVGFFVYQGVENKRIFIFDFLVLYIFYTAFEIYGLSRKLRRDLKDRL